MNNQYNYPGQELAAFEKAVNWKRYFCSFIKPFIGKNVLEVGGGTGANTSLLNDNPAIKWKLVEPDEKMSKILQKKIETESQFSNCTVFTKTIFQLSSKEQFDTIIYVDVLEHIQDDKAEMKRAFDLLCPGGHLIILSPAHNFLFSSFDKEIGHFRRYTASTLRQVIPEELELMELQYLDSIGLFALLAYKFFWNRPYPSRKQIDIWDRYIIPVSKRTDRIFFNAFGKSILGVWQK